MKKILLGLISLALLGCSATVEIDSEAPTLQLTKKRIHVDVNSDIEYSSYISEASDNVDGDNLIDMVEYTTIDTSETGKEVVTYTLTDSAGNETKAELIVDVVEYINDSIFNPESVEVETVDDPTDVTVLVNKIYVIDEDWYPDDLVSVCDDSTIYLRQEAAEAYEKFYNAAVEQGIELYSISGFRTYETQSLYYSRAVTYYGLEHAAQYNAYPGRSEHELGLAIDVSYRKTGERLNSTVATSDIGKFIVSDAYKYGFILRYQEDKIDITNYAYEPWHIRYVGVELATYLYENGLTLEEYYGE
ncbi:MAG: M15 family metallopeptidase [Erysipelotrichaceae bacterium]|nr:M15 family metallopeptidase [Erysipelotrichaceae bacterium]